MPAEVRLGKYVPAVWSQAMIVVCMKCQVQLDVKSGKGVSHGLCRLHFLTTCAENGLATETEKQELVEIKKRRKLA